MPLFFFAIFFILFIQNTFCTIYYTTYWLEIALGYWCTSPLHTYPYLESRPGLQISIQHSYGIIWWRVKYVQYVDREFLTTCIVWYVTYAVVLCTLFTRTEYNDHMNAGTPDWTCQKCVESAFPFNHIIDDDVFHGCLHEFSGDHTLSASEYVQTKTFNPFNLNDDKDHIPCSDIDPDSCYYQVEGRSWIYVQHVNLAFLGGRPVNLRATRKFTGQ